MTDDDKGLIILLTEWDKRESKELSPRVAHHIAGHIIAIKANIEAQAAEIEFHKERADALAMQADEWEGKYLIGIAEIEHLRELLAAAYIELSGKDEHASDCATSNAPAMTPGRCDCD